VKLRGNWDCEKIGLSKSYVDKLLESEVSPNLVFGEITIESGDILSTIQDGLGMDPEEAKTVLFSILHNKERRLL